MSGVDPGRPFDDEMRRPETLPASAVPILTSRFTSLTIPLLGRRAEARKCKALCRGYLKIRTRRVKKRTAPQAWYRRTKNVPKLNGLLALKRLLEEVMSNVDNRREFRKLLGELMTDQAALAKVLAELRGFEGLKLPGGCNGR